MIRSILLGSMPAASIAARLASQPRSLTTCSGGAKWRSRMPVRSTIHSSEVFTPRATRSALVTGAPGK